MTTRDGDRAAGVLFPFSEEAMGRLMAAAGPLSIETGATVAPERLEVLVGSPALEPAAYPKLRWLQVPSAGVEALGLAGWTERGVVVTNARGVYAVPIAQYVIGAVLAAAERHQARAAQQARGTWPADEAAFIGRPVRGATVVILGYGGIGREVARLATAHGMRVLAVKARPEIRADDGFRLPGTGDPDGSIPEAIVGMEELASVARKADYLAVTAPLTRVSRGVVSSAVLDALPGHAWLINIARGPLVDEGALLAALDAGRLAGAVLDVFAREPLPDGHPFWRHPRVIVTPHIAGGPSDDAFEALVRDNLDRWARGVPLRNVVDPVRTY